MEAIFGIMVLVASLVAFDFAASRWGVDSRDWKLDDYRR